MSPRIFHFASRRASRRGTAIIYGVVVMSVLIALCSLAVDYGRAQLVRTELQSCADGAARAAASGISTGVEEAKKRARDLGVMNRADGEPVAFTDADFRFGRWNASTDQIDTSAAPVDAVEVTARRTVSLVFGAVLGRSSVDVAARATARGGTSNSYAIVGLDSITMSGNAHVDSYNSTMGPYSPAAGRPNGDLATNGSLTLGGTVNILGDATYKTTFSLIGDAAVIAPGAATKVTSTISYANPSLPPSYTDMGVLDGSGNNSLTLTTGNYYFTSFRASGSFTLNVAGKVNIYVAGPFHLSGNMNVQGNLPGNFRVNVMGTGAVEVGGTSVLYADVYAPNSPVHLSGTGDLYGRFLGKRVDSIGNGNIHFDENLAANLGGGITLMK